MWEHVTADWNRLGKEHALAECRDQVGNLDNEFPHFAQ